MYSMHQLQEPFLCVNFKNIVKYKNVLLINTDKKLKSLVTKNSSKFVITSLRKAEMS